MLEALEVVYIGSDSPIESPSASVSFSKWLIIVSTQLQSFFVVKYSRVAHS